MHARPQGYVQLSVSTFLTPRSVQTREVCSTGPRQLVDSAPLLPHPDPHLKEGTRLEARRFFPKNPQSPASLPSREGSGRACWAQLSPPLRKPAALRAVSSVCTSPVLAHTCTHMCTQHTHTCMHTHVLCPNECHMVESVGFGSRGCVQWAHCPHWPQSPQLHEGLDHAAPATGACAGRSPRLRVCDIDLSF